MKFLRGSWLMILILSLVLYCEKKHGTGRELQDFSQEKIIPAPVWAQQGIIYQVFPRVFTHEGDFRALQQKLDYIQQLGVNILWLMPIYPIGEKDRKGTIGSPFSVKNFRKINPDYGTQEDFRNLVNEIHQRNMKVIIGIVPNHSSNDNNLMKDHPSWFMQDSLGNFTREVGGWSDITDFNYENPEMRQYMKETPIYWVKEFDVDGFRCDVAGMVPYDFWNESLKSLREVKSNIFLLAEWEDPKLLMRGFNSDYDWTLYHLLKDIREGKKKTAEAISLIQEKDSRYPQNSLPMRFLENHDEQRSLHVFGKEAMEAYATFIFMVPGIPLIYAGQEIGEERKPSLFEKSELNWTEADSSLIKMYQSLIQLRKRYSCLTNGTFFPLQTITQKGSVGAFLREDDKSIAMVVCNLDSNFSEKILIRLSEERIDQLKQFEFVNYKDSDDKLNLHNLRFEQINPLTTLVYMVQK
jgi:cyclomaltodextrinase